MVTNLPSQAPFLEKTSLVLHDCKLILWRKYGATSQTNMSFPITHDPMTKNQRPTPHMFNVCTLKAANELGICIIKVAIKFLQTILFHIVGTKPKVPTETNSKRTLFVAGNWCWNGPLPGELRVHIPCRKAAGTFESMMIFRTSYGGICIRFPCWYFNHIVVFFAGWLLLKYEY